MADLVLGPLLRYVSETEATVWVETDEPCEVEVLGRREPTFRVDGPPLRAGPDRGPRAGRLLRVRGRARRRAALAGARLGPAAERDPHPRPRRAARHLLRLLPGRAARTSAPYTADQGRATKTGYELDALRVLAERDDPRRARASGPSCSSCSATRSTSTRARRGPASKIRARRGTGDAARRGGDRLRGVHLALPGVLEDPLIRWLFSTVSTSMALGRPRHERRLEHLALLAARRWTRKAWWHERAVGGHHELLDLPAPRQPLAAGARRETSSTRGCAATADATDGAARVGATRSTPTGAGHPLELLPRHRRHPGDLHRLARRPGARPRSGARCVDEEEWDWIVEHAEGDFDHLLIATTVPFLLSPGFHHLEAWNERVCDGAWGGAGARGRARSCGAPSTSTTGPPSQTPSSGCASCSTRSARAGAARRRPRSSSSPATSTTPTWPRSPSGPGASVESAVYQAVCSPYRNPLDRQGAAGSCGPGSRARFSAIAHAGLARLAGRSRPGHPLAHARGALLRQPGRDAAPRRPRRARCGSTRPSPARRTRARWKRRSSAG